MKMLGILPCNVWNANDTNILLHQIQNGELQIGKICLSHAKKPKLSICASVMLGALMTGEKMKLYIILKGKLLSLYIN